MKQSKRAKRLKRLQAISLMEIIINQLELNIFIFDGNRLAIGPKHEANKLSEELWLQLRKFKRTIIQIIRTGLLEL